MTGGLRMNIKGFIRKFIIWDQRESLPWGKFLFWGLITLFNLGFYFEQHTLYTSLYFLSASIPLIIAYHSKRKTLRFRLTMISIVLLLISADIFGLEMEQFEEFFIMLPIIFVLLYPGKFAVNFISIAIAIIYFMHPGDESISNVIEDVVEVVLVSTLSVLVSYQYEKLKDKISLLDYESAHDELTSLPNRRAFISQVEKMISSTPPLSHPFAIILINIDNFKEVNDRHGHKEADEVLQLVGRTLNDTVNDTATLYRVTSDEFAILADSPSTDSLQGLAEKIHQCSKQSFNVKNNTIDITLSLGITQFPQHADTSEAISTAANMALQHSKKTGKNKYSFYRPEIGESIQQRYQLIEEMKSGIENDEFIVYYQPKNNVSSGAIIAAEALVRWRHPTRGIISPYHFIQLAEDTGMIKTIGEIVLKEACLECVKWHRLGLTELKVSVNLSAVQLKAPSLVNTVHKILEETGLDGRYLELEVTEGTLIVNPKRSIVILNQLKALGVSISMDDFGVGYSSFTYLQQLPIDTLKLDRLFVKDLESNRNDRVIAKTVIGLGHNLDLNVVAEGVETEYQLNFIKAQKCHQFQGYLVSPPVPSEEFINLVTQEVNMIS